MTKSKLANLSEELKTRLIPGSPHKGVKEVKKKPRRK